MEVQPAKVDVEEKEIRTAETVPSKRDGGKEKVEEEAAEQRGTEKESRTPDEPNPDPRPRPRGGRSRKTWRPIGRGSGKTVRQYKKKTKPYIPPVSRNDRVARQLYDERQRLEGEFDAAQELFTESDELGRGSEAESAAQEYRQILGTTTVAAMLRDEGATLQDFLAADLDIGRTATQYVAKRDEIRNRIEEDPTQHIRDEVGSGRKIEFVFRGEKRNYSFLPLIVLCVSIFLASMFPSGGPEGYFTVHPLLIVGAVVSYLCYYINKRNRVVSWIPCKKFFRTYYRLYHKVKFRRLVASDGFIPSRDMRAEAIALGKLKYNDPILAEFKYSMHEKRKCIQFDSSYIISSLEVVGQIAHAANIRQGMTDHEIFQRLQRSAETLNAVNIDRYDFLGVENVVVNSVIVAYAFYKNIKYRLKRSRFPFPSPPV
jgi:hypothetical protein